MTPQPKTGSRALGFADSADRDASKSTVCGAIVRADRVLCGLTFGSITVGGTDSTEQLIELTHSLDRPDIQYVLISGIAPAWFNVIDLTELAAGIDRPVISVSFEESEGLGRAIREAWDGAEREQRLDCYHRQPARTGITVNDEQIYVRSDGCDAAEAARIVTAFTPEGGRPEPIRVARIAARAGDQLPRRTAL